MANSIRSEVIFVCLFVLAATLQAGFGKPTTISDTSAQESTTAKPAKVSHHLNENLPDFEQRSPAAPKKAKLQDVEKWTTLRAKEGIEATGSAGSSRKATEQFLKKEKSKNKKMTEEAQESEDYSDGDASSNGWGEQTVFQESASDVVSKARKSAAKSSSSHKKSSTHENAEETNEIAETNEIGTEISQNESETSQQGSEAKVDGAESSEKSKTRKNQLDSNETSSKIKHKSSKGTKSMFYGLPEESELEFQKYKEAEERKNEEESEGAGAPTSTARTTTTTEHGKNAESSSASLKRAACSFLLTVACLVALN